MSTRFADLSLPEFLAFVTGNGFSKSAQEDLTRHYLALQKAKRRPQRKKHAEMDDEDVAKGDSLDGAPSDDGLVGQPSFPMDENGGQTNYGPSLSPLADQPGGYPDAIAGKG